MKGHNESQLGVSKETHPACPAPVQGPAQLSKFLLLLGGQDRMSPLRAPVPIKVRAAGRHMKVRERRVCLAA